MNTRIALAAGLVLGCLLAGCAIQPGQRDRPDWIDGQASAWPASRYLTGQGTGSTRALAENRARADLALVLEARIAAELRDETRFEASSADTGPAAGELTSRVTRKITARTNQVIRGIEIADVWRAPDGGEYHALAVLERWSAQRLLQGEIRALDDKTALQIELSRASADPLAAIAAASRAVEAQGARGELQKMLQVIDRSGRGIPPRWSLARLTADRDALVGRITLQAKVADGLEEELGDRLAAALAHAGFKVVKEGDDARYVVSIGLDVDDLGRQEGWFWQKGTLTLTLQDRDGRVRGARDWDIKQAGRDSRLARRRVMDQVNRILDESLLDTIIGFAEP